MVLLSWGGGVMLRDPIDVALPKDVDLRTFLVATWIDDHLRRVLKEVGYLQKDKNVETGGSFLGGYQGQLCIVENDFQVDIPLYGYDCVGSGKYVALGAIHAMSHDKRLPGETRVQRALQAATELTPYVRPPFTILQS